MKKIIAVERAVAVKETGQLVGAVGLVPSFNAFALLPGFRSGQERAVPRYSAEVGLFYQIARADRRQGYAGQVMRALAEWGEALGTEHVYLQVMENNPPALELYAKLSFKKLYGYYYLIKGVLEE